jgi:hypothetical protein
MREDFGDWYFEAQVFDVIGILVISIGKTL